MGGPGQPLHADDRDRVRSGTLNVRAHRVEQIRQVGDLGLAGGIPQNGRARGQGRGHHAVLGASHRRNVERDLRAVESLAAGFHVPLGEMQLRSHGLEGTEMAIDRPCADGTASRKGNARTSGAREQRTKDQEAGPHRLDEIVRRLRGCLGHALRDDNARLRPFDADAQLRQKAACGPHIPDVRHVLEAYLAVCQQRGRECRQGRVLRAADGHLATEGPAAVDPKLVHGTDSTGRGPVGSASRRRAVRTRGMPWKSSSTRGTSHASDSNRHRTAASRPKPSSKRSGRPGASSPAACGTTRR